MKLYREPEIGNQLEQAENLLRKIQLVKRSATILAAAALAFLVLGVCAAAGWIYASWLFVFLAALLLSLLAVAGAMVWLTTLLGPIAPDTTVAAVERSRPNLLDRLHTLLFLERTQPDSPWRNPIASQAVAVLQGPSVQPPFSWRKALGRVALCLVCIHAAVIFYSIASPYQTLRAREEMQRQSAQKRKAYEQLVIPETAPATDRNPAALVRGEIRIVRPGVDLQALPWEEIPLRIEAISPEVLQHAAWHSSVNAQPYTSRVVEVPADSKYLDWEGFIDLKELDVAVWDVIAYYATATAERENQLVSTVYFIDVVPVSAELDALPGGKTGLVAAAVNQLNRLVSSQQEAVGLVFDRNRGAAQVVEEWPAARRRLEQVQHLTREMLAAWRNEAIEASPGNQSEVAESLRQKWSQADQALQQAAEWVAAAESFQPDATQRQFPLHSPMLEAWQKVAELRKAYYQAAVAHPQLFAMQHETSDDDDPWARPSSSELGKWRQEVGEMRQRQELLISRDDVAAGDQTNGQPNPAAASQADLLNAFEEWLCERRDVADSLAGAFDATHRALQAASTAEEAQGRADRVLQQRAHDRLAELKADLQLLQHLKRHRELNDLARQLSELAARLRRAAQQETPIEDAHADHLAANVTQQYGKVSAYAEESLPPGWALRKAAADPHVRGAMQRGSQMANQAQPMRQAVAQTAQQAAETLASAALQDARRSAIDAHHDELDHQLRKWESQYDSATIDAARQEVVQLLQQQRQIQRDFSSRNSQRDAIQSRQRGLADRFQSWRKKHHQLSRATAAPCDRVSNAMTQSAETISRDRAEAAQHIERAGNALQDLDLALENLQQHDFQVQREHLGRMMQRHAGHFRHQATQADYFHPSQLPTACNLARQLANQAGEASPDPAAGRQFAQAVNEQSARLETSASPPERRDAAEQLANLLEGEGGRFCSGGALSGTSRRSGSSGAAASSSRAGSGRQPGGSSREGTDQRPQGLPTDPSPSGTTPGSLAGDPMATNRRSGEQSRHALARALRLLEMLAREQAGRPRLTDSQRQAVRHEAVRALEGSIPNLFGHNDQSSMLLERARRRLLEEVEPVDMQTVESLMRDIGSLTHEQQATKPVPLERSSSIAPDPSSVPPQYRRAVGRYFEKLAEQPQP